MNPQGKAACAWRWLPYLVPQTYTSSLPMPSWSSAYLSTRIAFPSKLQIKRTRYEAHHLSLHKFLQSSITSCFFDSNIFLRALFSNVSPSSNNQLQWGQLYLGIHIQISQLQLVVHNELSCLVWCWNTNNTKVFIFHSLCCKIKLTSALYLSVFKYVINFNLIL